MKLTKLFAYMVGLTTKPEVITFIQRGTDMLEASCTDGVTHVKVLLPKAGFADKWDHKGIVSVQRDVFIKALRDDARVSVDGAMLNVFGPRWRVCLPCDVLDRALASRVRPLPGEGLIPPEFTNVNTTDAFGADVWVTFGRRKSGGVVALISDYANIILFGQSVAEPGSFPAKLLPATKGLLDIRVRATDDQFSITGDYQLSAVQKVEVTVTASLPATVMPTVAELLDRAATVVGQSFEVNAVSLRNVVESVTKLMPTDTTLLRLRYKRNPNAPANSALQVQVSNQIGVFSETVQINTQHDGEVLLHTKMFATSLKGIALSKEATARVTHTISSGNEVDRIRVEIYDDVGTGQEKRNTRVAMLIMVAEEEPAEREVRD